LNRIIGGAAVMSVDFLNYINKLRHEPIKNLNDLCDFLLEISLEISGSTAGSVVAKDQLDADYAHYSKKGDLTDPFQKISMIEEKDSYVEAMISIANTLDEEKVELIRSIAWIAYGQMTQNRLIRRLRKSERIFNLTFEQVNSGRCVTDLEGYILETNEKFCDIIGYTQEEALGLRIKDLTFPDDWKLDVVYKDQLFRGEIPFFSMEKRYIKKNGELAWVYTTVTYMHGDENEDDFLIGIVQDIGSQKEADIESLTGLYNRRYMMTRLQDEVERYERTGKSFSLILTDIDYFKTINDDYGHDCGDEVLQVLSKVMKSQVRAMDVLCRWGGEEFLLLLPETDIEKARMLAERVRKSVLEEHFTYENKQFRLTMTFGVSTYEKGMSIKELIKVADLALYRGKELGRNRVV
jgi:diguanylate cyclase (GGDEF)-like protein/PAS domain S-box-containing protein